MIAPAGGGAAPPPLALYVHLPWCVRKCPYCDFNSHQLVAPRPDSTYVDTLLEDFAAESSWVAGRSVNSVFFGGGTPSLFPPEDFARLLAEFRRALPFAADAEITLEANPGAIERGRFEGYARAGINRISLGAQSFSQRALAQLGRIHSADDTHRAVEELRAAGFDNFNLDLMYALPGQTFEEAMTDVRTACALEPTHLSYYQLTLEPGTVFHARPPALPDDEEAWAIQVGGQELLAAAGFEQYEVSAYARAGRQCRHNRNYWLFGDYLGLGAGAHGKVTIEAPAQILRTEKPKQPREYRAAVREAAAAAGVRRAVPVGDLPFEFMLNALRLNEGFSLRCFEARTGLPAACFEEPMRQSMSRGLVRATDEGWQPTELGRRFLNDLQSAFLK